MAAVLLLAVLFLATGLLRHDAHTPTSATTPEGSAPAVTVSDAENMGNASGAAAGGAEPEDCAFLTAQGGAAVAQAPDGRLRGCLRVGPLATGPYTVQLGLLVSAYQGPPTGGRVELSPSHGPPGTTVRISGFSPGASVSGDRPSEDMTLCWDSCGSGFTQLQPVRWSPDGHFTTRFEVPAVPWLAVDGPHPLRPAKYRIGVYGSEDAEAVFRLETGEPKVCVEGRPCAHLEFTPAAAPPGAVVEVRGWAPLLSRPDGRYFLHVEEGNPNKDAVEIDPLLGGPSATVQLAPSRFTARPWGHRWADLPPSTPTLQVISGPSLAAQPGDRRLLVHCVPDGIRISRDGGAHWTVVETRTVPTATRGTGHRLASTSPVLCQATVPDPRHPGSVFAKFAVVPEGSEPPFYGDDAWGLFTVDGGRTWRRVPVPPGASMENFEGFTLSGGSVLARFRHRPEPSQWEKHDNAPARDWEPGMLVMETSDGGRTWKPGRDACPSHGPCVTWGPTAEYSCAKGRNFQIVRSSADGGRTWSSSTNWPGWVATCDAASLVSLPGGDVILLAADSLAEPFPFRLSRDGGSTWEPIDLPELPDTPPGPTPNFPNLTMLGDGRLLAVADDPSGPQLLNPGADTWCAVRGEPLGPAMEVRYQRHESIGDRLWWVDDHAHEARSVPLGDLRCK